MCLGGAYGSTGGKNNYRENPRDLRRLRGARRDWQGRGGVGKKNAIIKGCGEEIERGENDS